MITYEVGNAEYDLKNLEKLAFTYEKHPQEHQEIAQSEREKRIK
jgi:hypothetical protein